MNSRSFLRIFLFAIIFFCSLVISINVYINPYGYYGEKSLGGANIFNAQIAKYECLKQLNWKPDAYVLGSSNAMRMRPEYIDTLFGVKSFNYAVYQASIEDFYAITHSIVEDLDAKPKLFLICIDDWNFKNYAYPKDEVFLGAQNRLAYKPVISKHLKDFSWVKLTWSRFKSALSYEQLMLSKDQVQLSWRSNEYQMLEPKMKDAFYPNGVRKFYKDNEGNDITELAEKGKYDISGYLRRQHEIAVKKDPKGIFSGSHEDFKGLQAQRLDLLKELVSYLESHQVKIIFNVMPIQPYFKTIVKKYSGYDNRITFLIQELNKLKDEHPNVILIKDNRDIKNFNGLAEHFFDHIHPTSVNSDSMLISIKRNIKENAL